MQTAFTRLVGIDVPIVQAPIGGLAQSVGLIHDVRPAAELVRSISEEADSILRPGR